MAVGRSSSLADRIGRQYEQQFGRPASPEDPAYATYIERALPQMMAADQAQYERSKNRWNTFGRIATTAGFAPLAMTGMSGLFSGLGGASSGAGAGVAAGATSGGKLATLGRLFSSPGFDLGVNSGLTLLGMRSQGQAADRAREDQLAQYREGLALERQRLEQEARNADLDRADAKALNEAINELRRRELDATEEERSYRRGLEESREARLQPYRDLSLQALRQLFPLLGGS